MCVQFQYEMFMNCNENFKGICDNDKYDCKT